MANIFNVLFARHRNTYLKLAIKHASWPTHIYELAHGATAHGQKDSDILHDLLDYNIIHRHHHSQNPDDYEM